MDCVSVMDFATGEGLVLGLDAASGTAKQMTLYDWSDGAVLAHASAVVLDGVEWPTMDDWSRLFGEAPERPGTSAVLLDASCDTFDSYDRSASGVVPMPFNGYVYYVPDERHWTELDNTSLHKDVLVGDGGNGLPPGWRKYVLVPDLSEVDAYVMALATSPTYYYLRDTGTCARPTKEEVYRVFVDPEDSSRLAIEKWGNLGSTGETVYSRIYLLDATDAQHVSRVSVENGRLVVKFAATYISQNDLRNAFGFLLARDVVAADHDPEHLAMTNNELVAAFRELGQPDKVRNRRDDRKSQRLYVMPEDVKAAFGGLLGRRVDVHNFTFGELRTDYRAIVEGIRTLISKSRRADPEAAGSAKFVASEDGGVAFADILRAVVPVTNFALIQSARALNVIVAALETLVAVV